MKVDDFVIRRADRNVREFVDQSTLIFNYGKYSAQTVTSPPQWVARNGEFAFLSSGGANRVYFYANNQWNWIGGSPTGVTGATATPAGSDSQVQINSQNLFYADSGFVYKVSSYVGITRDEGYVFNADSAANTRIVYTTSNAYHEFYINGNIRLQM